MFDVGDIVRLSPDAFEHYNTYYPVWRLLCPYGTVVSLRPTDRGAIRYRVKVKWYQVNTHATLSDHIFPDGGMLERVEDAV